MSEKTLIRNVHLFDGVSMKAEPQNVTFENGLISNINPASNTLVTAENSMIVDGTGYCLIPGLIDCHVHIPTFPKDNQGNLGRLQSLTRCGVTTALDMGWMTGTEVKAVRKAANQPLTDIRFAGLFATASGSTHSRFHVPHSTGLLVDSEADAVRFVKDRIAEGADYIKIVADVPGPSQVVINKLVSEAHNAGKLTVAHAARKAAYAMAQEGNVDIVTHAPLDNPISEIDAAKMKDEGRVVCPTLVMCETMASKKIFPGLTYQAAKQSVSLMHRAGVTIIAGTDSNTSAAAAIHLGPSLWKECELLVDAGLSNEEVLQGATSLAAKHFRLHDRGLIEVGKRADLVLVEGNPLENIQAVESPRGIWINGKAVNLAD